VFTIQQISHFAYLLFGFCFAAHMKSRIIYDKLFKFFVMNDLHLLCNVIEIYFVEKIWSFDLSKSLQVASRLDD